MYVVKTKYFQTFDYWKTFYLSELKGKQNQATSKAISFTLRGKSQAVVYKQQNTILNSQECLDKLMWHNSHINAGY